VSTLVIVAVSTVLAALGITSGIFRQREARLRQHARNIRRHYQKLIQSRRADAAAGAVPYWDHFRSLSAPVMMTTPAGEIVWANSALVEMLGYADESELKQLQASQLYTDARERENRVRPLMQQNGALHNIELRFKKKDGTSITVLTSLRSVPSEQHGTLFEGVFTDVTELRNALEKTRQLEAQLLMAQKLEAIGQLASGIAHEINTPIQFVGDNTHFLRDSFSELTGILTEHRETIQAKIDGNAPQEILPALDAINGKAHLERLLAEIPQALTETFDGIERVAETVRAMKEFAHPDDGEMAAVDINQTIQTTLVVARNEYKHIADIVTDFGDLPEVYCRKGEINKVVLNLVVNAAHAMDGAGNGRGGKSTKRGTITLTTRESGEDVIITVADTGCGIPPAVLTRIFDPFFTTKPLGKGTGQGLAIAKSIIRDHGGRLEVASTVGKGTTFTITLPNRSRVRIDHTEAQPDSTELRADEANTLLLTGNTR
jgi:two-component system, NtrC family, sensor kinase